MEQSEHTVARALQLLLVSELRGTHCAGCLGTKKASMSVCYTCWKKLPAKVRNGLYQRIGDGYEAAHAEAMDILHKKP